MNFSIFNFSDSKDKKNSEVICHIKSSKEDRFVRRIEVIAAILIAGATIASVWIASKNYIVSEKSYRQTVEMANLQTQPLPSVGWRPQNSGLVFFNNGMRPMQSVRTFYRIVFDQGGLSVIDPGHKNFTPIIKKDLPFFVSTEFAKYEVPKTGFIFIIAAMESPSLDSKYVQVIFKIIGEPSDKWYLVDESLWSLGDDHRAKLAPEIALVKERLSEQ